MRESIKVIKWCGCFMILFLVLAYIVSVNIEAEFIAFDSPWLSNNFLFTLFGGVFASMLIVVLCEIQKYLSAKADTEQHIFLRGLYLYQTLEQMRVITNDYLNHQDYRVTENLFDESVRMMEVEMSTLQTTDYATFKQKQDTLMFEHGKFRAETLQKLQPLLQSGIRLRIAINEAQIEDLRKQMGTHQCVCSRIIITSSRQIISQTLEREADLLSQAVALIDRYLTVVDNYCGKRFQWAEVKVKLHFQHIDELMDAGGTGVE